MESRLCGEQYMVINTYGLLLKIDALYSCKLAIEIADKEISPECSKVTYIS